MRYKNYYFSILSALAALSFSLSVLAEEPKQKSEGSDWGIIERNKTDGTEIIKEDSNTTSTEEPFSEEDGNETLVETISKEEMDGIRTDAAARGIGTVCRRCLKKNHIDVQLLGFKTPVGFFGTTFTRHVMSRTSIQAGVGYGFGGYNFSTGMLHYLEEESSLYLLTGFTWTAFDNEKISDDKNNEYEPLEGLWINFGFSGSISTQTGITYSMEIGTTMAVLEDAFTAKMKFCFGYLAQSNCRERWRIMPYITPAKLGYRF